MLKFTTMRRGGLECGTTGAKLVLLARRKAVFDLEDIFIEDIPFESRIKGKARLPLDTTRHLLLHKNLSGCRMMFVAHGAVDGCFVILPKMGKAETDSAILLQSRKIISWESENPVLAYSGAEFLRDRTGYLVGLADWKSVKAWCRLIENSGSLIEDVTIGACAYQALARWQKWADEFPVFLVADLGAVASSFYILDRQKVKFMRKIPVGGDALTRVLTTEVSTVDGRIRLVELEAEEVKITGYLTPTRENEPGFKTRPSPSSGGAVIEPSANQAVPKRIEQVEVLVRPVVERITSEILRSIQFFKDNVGQKVEAIYLTGGTAGLPALRTTLEASAGVPVRLIDPFSGLKFTNPGIRNFAEKHQTRLALATGLALAEHPAISLLPRVVQILKRLAVFVPRGVAALLILGFLPFLLAGTWNVIRLQSVRSEMRSNQKQIEQANLDRQRLDALQKQFQESSRYYGALQTMVGRNPLWSGVLNSLADILPPAIVLTRISAVLEDVHRPCVVVLEGKVLGSAAGFDDAMAALLPALNASVFFKKVNIIKAKANSAERSDGAGGAVAEPGQTESALGTFEIECELVR